MSRRGEIMDGERRYIFMIDTKSFLILLALLGPRRRAMYLSVMPGNSASPFFMITKSKAERSGPTIQPRTDFLFRSPSRLGLYPEWPGDV